MRLFEAIRKKSGQSIPQFARALGFERQHWHRLESTLVQGKLLRTFAKAVFQAGLSADEVMELLRGVVRETESEKGSSSAKKPTPR